MYGKVYKIKLKKLDLIIIGRSTLVGYGSLFKFPVWMEVCYFSCRKKVEYGKFMILYSELHIF